MSDLKSPAAMYLNAVLLVAVGLLSSLLLLLEDFRFERLGLLVVAVWAFCRAYYFAFYVIEHYVDPTYKFSGLINFFLYVHGKSQKRVPVSAAETHSIAEASQGVGSDATAEGGVPWEATNHDSISPPSGRCSPGSGRGSP